MANIQINNLSLESPNFVQSLAEDDLTKIAGGERTEQIFDDGSRLITYTFEHGCFSTVTYISYDIDGHINIGPTTITGIYAEVGCLDNIA